MADEELKKLKRNELLERLVQLTRENEELKAELVELRAKLADRTLDLLDTGSIAEASLKLNGVFEAAQAAANQYLDNIERLYKGRGELVREAQSKAQALVAQAKLDAQDQLSEVKVQAEAEANQVRLAAKVAADEARAQARKAQEDADEARRAALRARDEASEIITQAREDAIALIDRARADAEAEAHDITAKAQESADALLADARLQAQLRMDEAERVSRNFEMATKVRCDNAMRRAIGEAHTYGETRRMAMSLLGITPDMVPALEAATGKKAEEEPETAEASAFVDSEPVSGAAEQEPGAPTDVIADLDRAVNSARAAVAAALKTAKTAPGTLDEESAAMIYPSSTEQLGEPGR